MSLTKEQVNSLIINTRAYYDYQNERIRLAGQLGIKKSGELKKNIPVRDEELLLALGTRYDGICELEKSLEKTVGELIKKHPLWKNFLENVKGVGPMMAAVIITQFDIFVCFIFYLSIPG